MTCLLNFLSKVYICVLRFCGFLLDFPYYGSGLPTENKLECNVYIVRNSTFFFLFTLLNWCGIVDKNSSFFMFYKMARRPSFSPVFEKLDFNWFFKSPFDKVKSDLRSPENGFKFEVIKWKNIFWENSFSVCFKIFLEKIN